MTTKTDYTAEEWGQLMQAPILAGTYLIIADLAVTSVFKETAGMSKAILAQPVPEDAQDLVGALVADFQDKSKDKDAKSDFDLTDEQKKDPEATKAAMLTEIEEAANLVAEKGSAEEATGYKKWIMGVAQATAEAGREGGFLGIGSVRVSDQEKAALAELSSGLGL
ncbi:MAG: hypothetical protein U9R25_00390 [Chloroflexota bacterium]|nr:hypothetical protein [Chloroflexota bacterium]